MHLRRARGDRRAALSRRRAMGRGRASRMVEGSDVMLSGAGTATRLDEEWHRNGWILLPRLFSPAEVDAMLAETDRLLPGGRASGAHACRGALLKGDQRTDRLDPVIDLSPLFADVAKDGRLLGLASGLLGAEA